jgi:hypothetical protein
MALNFLNNIDLNKNQLLNAQIHNVPSTTLEGTTYIANSVAGQLAYDTTNNVLKVFNGTAYVAVDGASGTVTSVTGTAPISVTSGNTPAVSISAATTSAAGTMSAADKTKLNAITGTNTGDQDISGIATNASDITSLQTEQSTQDTAIGLNTLKETNVTTDLSVTATAEVLKVNSSDGTDATLPAATSTTWGVLNPTLYNTFDGKVNSNTAITGATKTKITYDSKGLVTAGGSLTATDIPALPATKITTGTIDPDRIPGLDASKITTGTIDATLLPSYVDDVLEFDDSTVFPGTGATGKIYIAIDTNKTYRWSGSTYVQITSGAVDTVSGRTGAVVLTKADVDLGNVDNTSDTGKPVSTATDATSKANSAQSAAETTAAADATTKAADAQAAAISAAASDATTKANSAQSAAISAAATDATNKANSAVTTAATAENSKTKVATILKESLNADGRAVTITHSFGSKNVVVQLFDAVTNLTVFADVERYSINAVKVDFGRTPANNVVCLLTNLAAAGSVTPTY